jgi:hypothetical protein
VTIESGTACVMPYSKIGERSLVEQIRDPGTADKVGYFGNEPGIPAIVPSPWAVTLNSHRRLRQSTVAASRPETTDSTRVPNETRGSVKRTIWSAGIIQ